MRRGNSLHLLVFGRILLEAKPPLKLFLEGYPWRIFVLRQDGPLRTPLSGFTTLTLIRLQVLRSCLFEPTVCCWFIIGPDRQRFQLGVFGISFPMRKASYAA